MITESNLTQLLESLNFVKEGSKWKKNVGPHHSKMAVNFANKTLEYPPQVKVNSKTAVGFSAPENFVVFECVHRLLSKGYKPEHIEIEKRWSLGHQQKSGVADICVYDASGQRIFLIIECKTFGSEYDKAIKILRADGGQLFSYRQQERSVQWMSLYASSFDDGEVCYQNDLISCLDDPQMKELAKQDESIILFEEATSAESAYLVWKETYGSKLWPDLIFSQDTVAYKIGIKPLRKKNLRHFSPDDNIITRFEEILRHNNVSDKENAFNRLIALFICKLVDEVGKSDEDILDFQYKQGTDNYETLQDRLQRLHQEGMQRFMKEEIVYIPSTYPAQLFSNYTGSKREAAIADLQEKLRILKFFSNNDFAFKDVHNEELFLQNGKVLVEMVQLFEGYQIIYPSRHQFLGDMFEQLLNQGFKQNEGQFFTPIPITRFIWECLPVGKITQGNHHPKVIDYACGSGHFLTEAIEAINSVIGYTDNNWVRERVFGVEKDYRLARVAKITLFMNGSGEASIVYGDGLDNYPEQGITESSFDVLVANPPYSVRAFKSHLALKNNELELLDDISHDGGEIELLFIERAAQLVKPGGVAAIILPFGTLNKSTKSFVSARELLFKNFYLRAIVQFGTSTFGATGTNTVVLFLERFTEPPKLADLAQDSIEAIVGQHPLENWEDAEILAAYLEEIGVDTDTYSEFLQQTMPLDQWETESYFSNYLDSISASSYYQKQVQSVGFQKLTKKQQHASILRILTEQTIQIEKEKILHFALTYDQNTTVVIAPDPIKDQKKFLGYSWSKRRGKEGIQIHDHGGELFDPQNRFAENTVANLIRSSFDRQDTVLGVSPSTVATTNIIKTSDLLDFRGPSFTKSLTLVSQEQIRVKSQFELTSLTNLVALNTGMMQPKDHPEQEFAYIDVSTVDKGTGVIVEPERILGKDLPSRARRTAAKDDILIATVRPNLRGFALLSVKPEPWTIISTGFAVLTVTNKKQILPEFLYVLFQTSDVIMKQIEAKMGKGQYPSINATDLNSLQVPVPPLSVQKTFLAAHKIISTKFDTSRMSVKKYREMVQKDLRDMGIIDFEN